MNKIIVSVFFALFIIGACPLFAQEKEHPADPALTITMDELKDHVYFLSSDSLEGRGVGQRGYRIAVDYVISQFKSAGLLPVLKDKDGNPTFLQELPLLKRKFSSAEWVLHSLAGEKTLPGGKGLKASRIEKSIIDKPLQLVFVGYGISEPEHGWDDFQGLDLENKIVVIMTGTPQKNGQPILPPEIENSYHGSKGLLKKMNFMEGKMKANKYLLLYHETWNRFLNSSFDASENQSTDHLDLNKREMFPAFDSSNETFLLMDLETSKYLMKDQKYSPFENPDDLLSGYKTFPLRESSITFKAAIAEEIIFTWNVVGLIPGSDEKLKKEYLAVGAHLDGLGIKDNEIYNGADDNASGSAGVIEVGEALAQKGHKRSIFVCLWAAEESYLKGSESFVFAPPVPLENIYININLDMIGRQDKKDNTGNNLYIDGAEQCDPSLKEFIETINSSRLKLDLSFSTEATGVSDYIPFLDKGIPGISLFSGIHGDYHQTTDDAEKIDYRKMLKSSRLAYYLLDEMANTAICLDKFKKMAKAK